MVEEQKWQDPGGHSPCANNCGFFGSPTTLDLVVVRQIWTDLDGSGRIRTLSTDVHRRYWFVSLSRDRPLSIDRSLLQFFPMGKVEDEQSLPTEVNAQNSDQNAEYRCRVRGLVRFRCGIRLVNGL